MLVYRAKYLNERLTYAQRRIVNDVNAHCRMVDDLKSHCQCFDDAKERLMSAMRHNTAELEELQDDVTRQGIQPLAIYGLVFFDRARYVCYD